MKYRQPQILMPQSNGEAMTVKSTNHKSYSERRMQNANVSKPSSVHQTIEDENNSSQTNIVTTVIVNNSNIDSNKSDNNESLSSTNNSNLSATSATNKKYDFKIEQHIVSKINNESYKGTEKSEVSCVNIKSSIEVKQNGNDDQEFDDSVTQPKPIYVDDNTKPKESTEESQEQDDKVFSEAITTESEVPESLPSTTVAPTAPSTTWAGILKKSNSEFQSKPTAFIAPHNVTNSKNESSANDRTQGVQKTSQHRSSIPNDTQQKSDASVEEIKSSNNEKVHCDDPNTYRMGGK